MTLILSCITNDFVLQVSDRCLSDLRTGRSIEQEANKAVFLSNRVAFAYTGLAVIEGKPADIWLRDVLTPSTSIGDGVRLIVDEATRAFAEMPGSLAAKRQAFVGAGWTRFSPASELEPFCIIISNALARNGSWLPRALPEFSGEGKRLHSGCIWTDLSRLPARRKTQLNRVLRNLRNRGLGAGAVARCFVNEVRAIADVDTSVGRGLMVNSIPRAATQTSDFLGLSGMPTSTDLTFGHLRHDDSLEVTEGPHVVRPGGHVFSSFKHVRHPDGSETVGVSLRAA